MQEKIAHYGLRVFADYTSVVFPVGKAQFSGEGVLVGDTLCLSGEGTLTLTGAIALTIEGAGSLTVCVSQPTSAVLTSRVPVDGVLQVTCSGAVLAPTRIVHTVRLAHGAEYNERITAVVHTLFDVATTVQHDGKAQSTLEAKVAVLHGAKAIIREQIAIAKGAEGSTGFAHISGLLLAPHAEIDALPTLVLDTDDVACKHAVSVGHVDPEIAWYLASRGCDKAEVRDVLTQAFLYG